jgi:hypothetical protein
VEDIAAAIATAQHPLSLYEIVPSDSAVRPYFDMEYDRTANPDRQQTTDAQLVNSILDLVAAYCKTQGWPTTIDRAATVLLDASNTHKFSQHLIVHLTGNAALTGVQAAAALAAWVCRQLPQTLLQAKTAAGEQKQTVDTQVYHKRQQMRLMGCVKLGDSRVLQLQHPQQTTLEDTLLSVLQPAATYGSTANQTAQGLHHPAPAAHAGHGMLSSGMTAQVERALCGGYISSIHQHSRHGTAHPSIYAHTTSTHCAHRQHASNKAVVEIDCRAQTWRILCRDGCKPGPWHTAECACVSGNTAPAWLRAHCLRWNAAHTDM